MRNILLAAVLLFGVTDHYASTYYVNSNKGNDNNNGRSASKAWASVYQVNQQTFEPGDKILFKAGTIYSGALEPKGSGKPNRPIIID